MPATIHRWRAFALLAVAFFVTIADLAIVNVALPTIGRDLHFSESNLQWVVTAYGLTFGGLLLLGGRAADLLGRRRIFMAGLAIFTLASLACALSTNDWTLITMRGLQGVGAAVILPAALSIVMNMFEEGPERNKALGLWGAVGATGATFGVLAGGILTRYVGWEYIFFLNVPIGVVALALTRRIVPESRLETARRGFDVLGGSSVTAGLLLLVYAISKAPDVGWASGRSISLLVVSGLLLVAFVVIEARVETPLMPLGIFKLKTLAGANVVGFLLGASFFAFIFVGHALHAAGAALLGDRDGSRLARHLGHVGRVRRTVPGARHAAFAQARDGARHGDDRCRSALDEPGRSRPLPDEPLRPVLHCGCRDGIRIHPDLDRRSRRRPGA